MTLSPHNLGFATDEELLLEVAARGLSQPPPPGSHPVTAYLIESGDGVTDCPGAADGEPNCTAHFDATGRLVHIEVR